MFVLCSEHHAAAAVVAGCDPETVLQSLGGAPDPGDPAMWATFDHAIRITGDRRVIVCGHLGCLATPVEAHRDPRTASQAGLVAQCQRLLHDGRVGALIRDHGVTLHALWFDDPADEVYTCDLAQGTATRMPHDDLARMLARTAIRPR